MPKRILTPEQIRQLASQWFLVPDKWKERLFRETDAKTVNRYFQVADNLYESATLVAKTDEAHLVLIAALVIVCKRIVDNKWI